MCHPPCWKKSSPVSYLLVWFPKGKPFFPTEACKQDYSSAKLGVSQIKPKMLVSSQVYQFTSPSTKRSLLLDAIQGVPEPPFYLSMNIHFRRQMVAVLERICLAWSGVFPSVVVQGPDKPSMSTAFKTPVWTFRLRQVNGQSVHAMPMQAPRVP